MQFIPAIDIRGGKCVRLRQGDPREQTVYNESPLKVAREFARAGAQKIHIVDLDGAIENASGNMAIIQQILEEIPVEIELGGGIRSIKTMRFWLNLGIQQVILGTVAMESPRIVRKAVLQFGAEKIIVGIDAKGGKAATHGWQSVTDQSALTFGKTMEDHGVQRFIYTVIETDGMLSGPDTKELEKFARTVGGGITASGGVRNTDDLRSLKKYQSLGIDSVIVGRAIYEGKIDVAEAVELLGEEV